MRRPVADRRDPSLARLRALQDVSAPDAPARIAEALKAAHGGVDVVVHNAGVTRDRTIAKMKRAHWDQANDINLGAVIAIDEALIGQGVLRDGGRVVCLSSVAGIAGNMGQTNYAASKAGIIGYVEALAPRGITVNAIAPSSEGSSPARTHAYLAGSKPLPERPRLVRR